MNSPADASVIKASNTANSNKPLRILVPSSLVGNERLEF